jgi:DnaJ-class molecular chaperone
MTERAEQMNGQPIQCSRCSGHGLVRCFHEHDYPDECPDCGGSGKNWRYPRGAIARYYSGPLIGRETP